MRQSYPVLSSFVTITLVLGLAHCNKPLAHSYLDNSAATAALQYRYDSQKETCVDLTVEPGHNEGQLVECGRVVGERIRNKDFRDRSLKGLVISNSKLWNVDFSGSDMEGAQISHSTLDFISFVGTNLSGAEITPLGNLGIYKDGLLKAQFDFDTQTPFHVSDMLSVGATLKKVKKNSVDLKNLQDKLQVTLSEKLSKEQRAYLENDFQRLVGLEFDHEKLKGSNFERFFGSTSTDGIVKYLAKGIGFIAPISKLDEDAFRSIFGKDLDVLRGINLTKWLLQGGLFEALELIEGAIPSETSSDRVVGQLGQSLLMKESEGVRGSVRLGMGYLAMHDATIPRIGFLIHEARHSYCPAEREIIQEHKSDRVKIEKKIQSFLQEKSDKTQAIDELRQQIEVYEQKYSKLINRPSCGYDHFHCPKSFPVRHLRERPACEKGVAYGAYATEGVVLAGVARGCINCTEKQRQAALAGSVERFTRVLDLDAVLENRYGEPSFEGL